MKSRSDAVSVYDRSTAETKGASERLHRMAMESRDGIPSVQIKEEFPVGYLADGRKDPNLPGYRQVIAVYRAGLWAHPSYYGLEAGLFGQFYRKGSFYRLVLTYEEGAPVYSQQRRWIDNSLVRYGRNVTTVGATTPEGAASQARVADEAAFCLSVLRLGVDAAVAAHLERVRTRQEQERAAFAEQFQF